MTIRKQDEAQTLLDRIDALRHPCDLDLLIFFVKHPHTLMASEQLATFMGYDIKRLAHSLDVLLEAGLITRSQNRAQVARMYVLAADGVHTGWLPALVTAASTPAGRLALINALKRRASEDSAEWRASGGSPGQAGSHGPSLVRPTTEAKPSTVRTTQRRGRE